MSDLKDRVCAIKKTLPRGSQRKIAKLIGSHPNQVAMAFDGFINNQDYLKKLLAQAEIIINDNDLKS